jgi:peptidoglycan/xylan/chitin deacetylase (PgdA/CDA1 family)
MLRRLLKQLVAGLIYYLRIHVVIGRLVSARRNQPLILMYHCVLPGTDARRRALQPGLIVTDSIFDQQLAFLSKHYRIRPLVEVVDQLDKGRGGDLDCAVITFDDGWRDNYEFAYPLLKKHGVPATIFLTTDFIGTNKLFWFVKAALAWPQVTETVLSGIVAKVVHTKDQLFPATELTLDRVSDLAADFDRFAEFLKRVDQSVADGIVDGLASLIDDRVNSDEWLLNWEQVREMSREQIDFGSHGCRHTIMTKLSPGELTRELEDSRQKIKQELGTAPTVLAYPNGDCNDSVRQAAGRSGYKGAVIVGSYPVSREIDLMTIPRVSVHDGCSVGVGGRFSPALFVCHVHGIL